VTRLRTLPALLARTARVVPWWHLALGVVAAFGLAWPRRAGPWTNQDDAVFGLRLAAVALAASAAFVFDDPAASLEEGKPVPVGMQRTARLLLVVPAMAAAWWALVVWMEAGLRPLDDGTVQTVPRLAVSVEMAALLGVVWAVATHAVRSHRDGGMVAVPVLLGVVIVLLMLPERWSLFPSPWPPPAPGEAAPAEWQAWLDAHRRWAALGAAAWTATLLGLRGPGRRRIVAWRRFGALRREGP
jgi:hypothetical protein